MIEIVDYNVLEKNEKILVSLYKTFDNYKAGNTVTIKVVEDDREYEMELVVKRIADKHACIVTKVDCSDGSWWNSAKIRVIDIIQREEQDGK